jgi:hypothetical protein
MSSIDPVAPGASLLHYRLVDRIGPTVWSAEDTRSGKIVAVKILTRQLPKDSFKRESLVRDVRIGAALYHSFLVNIIEIAEAGDVLLMAMDLVDGQPLSRLAKTKPADRTEFFRIAWQLVDVIKLLHIRDLTHLNINGDSVMVTSSGQVRLGGLNVNNLMKRDSQTVFQQRAGDSRTVAYMAPEQIGGEAVTLQADIWSIGVVLYELATGKLPFTGSNPTELAQRILEGQPSSPKAARPDIDPQVLAVMGRCLFKDPYRRHKDAKTMLEEIGKVEPDAQRFAQELVKSGTAATVAQSTTRDALLFVADVANYDELAASDPAIATKAAARMQQILGESVYLFDGAVVDPFGKRMLAELPSVDNAVEAARKGEFDFSPSQQDGDPLQVRMLLHAGSVTVTDSGISGEPVDRATALLSELPPMKLFLTEDFLKRGRGTLRFRDAGARAGMKLYQIVDPDPDVVVPLPPEETTAEIEAAEAEAAIADAHYAKAEATKRRTRVLAVVFGLLAVLVLGFVIFRPKPQEGAAPVVKKGLAALPPATAATPRKVQVSVSAADPALADRANAIALAVAGILGTYPEVRIADKAGADVTPFTATLRTGAAGPEIVSGKEAPVPAPDAASAITKVLQTISTELKLPAREAALPAAYESYTDAVAANAAHDNAKTDASVRAAMKADPKFLPAQLLAVEFFSAQGKEKDAVDAARQVFALDPTNIAAARRLARASLMEGKIADSFAAYDAILQRDRNDAEALNTLARYAAAAGDEDKFRAALARLRKLPPAQVASHEPDLLAAAGKVDAAGDKYYDVEVNVPRNAALSLKIGRISVLRHAMPIADIELQKLQELDPNYGYHILKAYIATQSGAKADAEAELKLARAASTPGDDYWTSVAEIAAMSADTKTVFTALENAIARKEPTASYVLSHPLFRYLQSDAGFEKIRLMLQQQQEEIRAALAKVVL